MVLMRALLFIPVVFAVNPLMSTLTYGGTQNAVFTAFTQTLIQSPASKVFDIVTDLRNYDAWNSFVTHVAYDGDLKVGTEMNFTDARIFPGTTYQSAEVFTSLSPSTYITSWRFDNTTSTQYAEHVTQIASFGPNTCLFISWETYYGPGSLAILAAVGVQLQAAFDQQGQDLKAYAELPP